MAKCAKGRKPDILWSRAKTGAYEDYWKHRNQPGPQSGKRLARNDKLVHISFDKGTPGKKLPIQLMDKMIFIDTKNKREKRTFYFEKSIWRTEKYRNCPAVISTLGHHDCALSKWKNAEIKRKQKKNEKKETRSTRYLLLSHTYSQVRLVKFIRNIPT